MKVCLFDIDGTLLLTGGAGQAAMEIVLQKEFGINELNVDIHAAGRTDRSIVTDLFEQVGIENTTENWNQFENAYLKTLPDHMGCDDGQLLPGVVELLNVLSDLDHVHLGLLTGNFEKGAWTKLSHYNIDHHFKFGGFGDHHYDRDDVARVALKATLEHLGNPIAAEEIWVIGDTPSDIQCSRAIGANVIAVATGIFDRQVLENAKPDELWNDLSNIDAMVELLAN